jgi:glutamyl/glutaminyl-tRNA synthetase
MVLRVEDLDPQRCRSEFYRAGIEDLTWFGLQWVEGPDVSGPVGPYLQRERQPLYLEAWQRLRTARLIYPCRCSRKDVLRATVAPHDEDDDPLYPGTCRPIDSSPPSENSSLAADNPAGLHWRFQVPDGEQLRFYDGRLGEQKAIAGKDFGDFLVWRRDGVPAYQLAVTVDDAAMGITEVVRGADLLTSTFRQLLLYRALEKTAPQFFHAPLVTDELGRRLAKRHASRSLRELRAAGVTPEEIRSRFL